MPDLPKSYPDSPAPPSPRSAGPDPASLKPPGVYLLRATMTFDELLGELNRLGALYEAADDLCRRTRGTGEHLAAKVARERLQAQMAACHAELDALMAAG